MLSDALNGGVSGFLTIPYRMVLKKDVSAIGALITNEDPCSPNETGNQSIGRFHFGKQEHDDRAEESEQRLMCQD